MMESAGCPLVFLTGAGLSFGSEMAAKPDAMNGTQHSSPVAHQLIQGRAENQMGYTTMTPEAPRATPPAVA